MCTEYISVVSAFAEHTRYPTVQHSVGISILKQLMGDRPLDTGGQVATAATDAPDETVIVWMLRLVGNE